MKSIPLTQGKVALIDDEDYEKLASFNWQAHRGYNGFYASRKIKRAGKIRRLYMHRIIMNPAGNIYIDHVNGDGLDNQKSNLRFCTNGQNQFNRRATSGSSRFRGIYWDKRNSKWRVRIKVNGKRIQVGGFPDEIEAAKAFDRAAVHYFGHFAKLNIPEEAVRSQGGGLAAKKLAVEGASPTASSNIITNGNLSSKKED